MQGESVMALKKCASCEGSGIYLDRVSTCPFCEGDGRMSELERNAYWNWFRCLPEKDKEAIKNKELPKWYNPVEGASNVNNN
jgi:RecJ-like exonuclease